jgi:methylenetetrahydrofolate dehydrogenase (NADP+)/methenyltetrahydrofolate cyclohydrolase
MAAEIIDGKKAAEALLRELAEEVRSKRLKPKLATVLVGNDPASVTYVTNKMVACAKVGISAVLHRLPESVSEEELLALVSRLNRDASVHGVLVQVPLPRHIDEQKALSAVAEEKDVDGFSARNLGLLLSGDESMPACTPAGVIRLVEKSGTAVSGANAVVVGRSVNVGKPIAVMLLNRDATVTVCHSKTRDLASFTRNADILCVAAGKPGLVSGDMVKPGATVIDVGTSRVAGKLVGDVDFASVSKVAGKITPVPGGVGPMTVAWLMRNTVKACERACGA